MRRLGAWCLALVVLGGCRDKEALEAPPGVAGPASAPLARMEDGRPFSFAPLVRACNPGVLNIYSEVEVADSPLRDYLPAPRRERSPSLGTGFVVDAAKGLALTNHHVIRGASSVRVRLYDGRELSAEIVGVDPKTDLALLRLVSPPAELVSLPLGDSDALEVGEWVLAIGNPLGFSSSVTAGIVSAKGRSEVPMGGEATYVDFIQTDASINPGNSGGPLLNMSGQVVGINTAVSREGQGIGFAIPINMAREVLPQLERFGRVSRSWLGIYVGPVGEAAASAAGLERAQGAVVRRVIPGGPAAEAGLQEGDIIVGFDGEEVPDIAALRWKSAVAGEGHRARLRVRRGREEVEVLLTLARNPNE